MKMIYVDPFDPPTDREEDDAVKLQVVMNLQQMQDTLLEYDQGGRAVVLFEMNGELCGLELYNIIEADMPWGPAWWLKGRLGSQEDCVVLMVPEHADRSRLWYTEEVEM